MKMVKLNMKKLHLIIICLSFYQLTKAQFGGESTYDFLNLTNSAKIGALGGTNVSISDEIGDLNFVFHNPALLKPDMSKALVLNYVPYIADINYGYVAYAQDFKNIGTFSFGIHNANYGDFTRTNEYNEILGTASAAEYAFILTYARQLSPYISMGLSIKPVYSKFDAYSSFGLATDFGFNYCRRDKNFSFGLVLRNLGSQISSYSETKENMPSDLQMGITKRLAHAPFRFSLTAQNLLDWDLTYNTSDESGSSSSSDNTEASFGDKFMRHMVIGVEFLPAKNFHIDLGYNHRRRKELGYEERMSTAGYSWGFGFRVYKFMFSYGSARYHLGGSSNHFSITTNLSNF